MKKLILDAVTAIAGFFAPVLPAFGFIIGLVLLNLVVSFLKTKRKRKEVENTELTDDQKEDKTFMNHLDDLPKWKLVVGYLVIVVFTQLLSYLDPSISFIKYGLILVGWLETRLIDRNFERAFGFSPIDKLMSAFGIFNKIKKP